MLSLLVSGLLACGGGDGGGAGGDGGSELPDASPGAMTVRERAQNAAVAYMAAPLAL